MRGTASSDDDAQSCISRTRPFTCTGLNTRDISSPAENENNSLREPSGYVVARQRRTPRMMSP